MSVGWESGAAAFAPAGKEWARVAGQAPRRQLPGGLTGPDSLGDEV